MYSYVYTVPGKWASSTTTYSLFWSENNSFIGNIRRVLAVYCCWLFLWLQQNLVIHKANHFFTSFRMSSFVSETSKGKRVFITIFFQINKLQPARINTFQRLICFDICYQNNRYFEPLQENSSINKGPNATCSLLVIPYVLICRKKTESPRDHKNLCFLLLVALIGLGLRHWYDNKNPYPRGPDPRRWPKGLWPLETRLGDLQNLPQFYHTSFPWRTPTGKW